MKQLQFLQETSKLTLAMRTRNSQLGKDLIEHLKSQLSLEEVAGLMLISIEQLVFWSDAESLVWTIKHLIPADVMEEMQKITSLAVFKRLIGKGLIPGQDFSVNSDGQLLLNQRASVEVLTP